MAIPNSGKSPGKLIEPERAAAEVVHAQWFFEQQPQNAEPRFFAQSFEGRDAVQSSHGTRYSAAPPASKPRKRAVPGPWLLVLRIVDTQTPPIRVCPVAVAVDHSEHKAATTVTPAFRDVYVFLDQFRSLHQTAQRRRFFQTFPAPRTETVASWLKRFESEKR